jgi:tetratricopeptide (TPR) repeat protein
MLAERMPETACSACSQSALAWTTVRVRGVPVDRLECGGCHTVHAVEDWELPLGPIRRDGCWNCGGVRVHGRCHSCGLSEAEAVQVHWELADLVDPGQGLLRCAGVAAQQGRKVLALKLATGAVHRGHHPAVARLLRISLLQDLDEVDAALVDCEHWLRQDGRDSGTAWTLLGELLDATGRSAQAIDAFERAVSLAPDDAGVRVRLAGHLMNHGRFGLARQHLDRVFLLEDPEATALARGLVARYARRLMDQGDRRAVDALLDEVRTHVRYNGTLMAVLAWSLHQGGHTKQAQKALRMARELQPDLDLLETLRQPLGIRRWSTGWFS